MATCPRCKGHLTDHHRCPRRPFLVALEIGGWAIAGALGGLLLVALFDPHDTITDDTYSVLAIGGALTAAGIRRLFRT